MSPPPAFLVALLGITAIAACSAPSPTARRTEASAVARAETPRSPGNAALAVRAAFLFASFCKNLNFAGGAAQARSLGFKPADPATVRYVLRDEPGEVLLADGYDKYTLIMRSGEARSCELGVHLATVEQIEAPFAASMQRLRNEGFAISPLARGPDGLPLYRVVAPDGQERMLGVIPARDPSSPIRSVLIAVGGR